MEKLFITDNGSLYKVNHTKNKILIRFHVPSVIQASTFHNSNDLEQFNDQFYLEFLSNGDRITNRISTYAKEVHDDSQFDCVSPEEWSQSLSYYFLEEAIQNYFIVEDILTAFSAKYKCALAIGQLSHEELQFEPFLRHSLKLHSTNILKNKLRKFVYSLFDLRSIFSWPGKYHYLYMLTDAQHHFELLKDVLMKQLQAGRKVAILVYPTQLGNTQRALQSVPPGVDIFKISQFRGSMKIRINMNLWKDLGRLNTFPVESNYTIMFNALHSLKPSVCIAMGYQNHTRYLSHVCRELSIPIASIDYSTITDDYRFSRRIPYDLKLTISQSQMDLWKKRNDVARRYEITGYLKYDQIRNMNFDRHGFNSKYALGLDKTVLFASSYGFDLRIKSRLVDFLSIFCHTNKFNLLVKKHPLEEDNICFDIISNKNRPNQVVLEHQDISSMECVNYSEIVVSQGSSIILDSLFFDKPFITYSMGKLSITDLMPIRDNKCLFRASTLDELNDALIKISNFESEDFAMKESEKLYFTGYKDFRSAEKVVSALEDLLGPYEK